MCFPLIGKLGKPKITQSLMTSVNSTCNVTLTCSVEKEEKNVIYSWSPLGEEGSVLQIFQTPENQQLTYTCIAQNPVSNNSDSISGQQLCSGNQLCPSLLEFHKSLWRAVRSECRPHSPGQYASLMPGLVPMGFSQKALETSPKPSERCQAFQCVLRLPPLGSLIPFVILTFNNPSKLWHSPGGHPILIVPLECGQGYAASCPYFLIISLHLPFPGIAMGLHTRHVGLLSGLAVLSLFILILTSVLIPWQ